MAGQGSAASIENAAELEGKNKALDAKWVAEADGAAETAAARASLAADAGLAPAPAPAKAAPAAPAVPAASAAPAAEPVAAAAAAAADQATQDYIDAIIAEAVGDKPADVLKIPASARIPLEVNGEIVYRTAADLRKGGMLEEDYTRGKQAQADERRELEEHAARLIADRARMDAREKFIADERKRLKEAQKSPEAYERYMNHLRMLEEDPEYAKTFEDALHGRELDAEAEAGAAARHREDVGAGVAAAATWMLEMAKRPEYKNVDLDRVREIYAGQLETGRAALDPSHVERIFKAEADQVSRTVGPLQTELAELRAQVAALTGKTDAAAAHNRTTQHAIERAAAPPVTTGMPAAPAPADRKVKPFTPRDLPSVNAEWNARRD